MKNGGLATVSVGREGDHPPTGVSVRILVTEDPSSAVPMAVRRDFFVQPGGEYSFYPMKPPWTSLSCAPGEFAVDLGDNAMLVMFEGRYRVGDVLETDCTAVTEGRPVQVPVIVSLFQS